MRRFSHDVSPSGHLVFVGLMGSGKSTVGHLVADQAGLRMCDNDELFERHSGVSASTYAERWGLGRLHRREMAALRLALSTPPTSLITAAASVADRPAMLSQVVEGHDVVFLDAPSSVLAERAAGEAHRPDEALAIIEERAPSRNPVMLELAALVVDVEHHDPDEAAKLVIDHFSQSQSR